MEIIGKVKIKWNDAPVSVPVTADGYIQMPDGTMRRLREETFQGIKEKLLATTPAQQTESESEGPAEPTEVAEPAGPTEPETSPAVSEPVSEAPVASAQDTAEELDKTDEPAVPSEPELKESAVPGEPEPKSGAPAQDAVEATLRANRKKERQERKAQKKQKRLDEKQKRKEEKLNAQKEDPESTTKTPMSPGKAAAIAVAAVLLAEAVLVAGYQTAQKNDVSFSGPEVTASVSGVGDIPDDAESVLIIARVKGDDGVERDIALGEFSPSV